MTIETLYKGIELVKRGDNDYRLEYFHENIGFNETIKCFNTPDDAKTWLNNALIKGWLV